MLGISEAGRIEFDLLKVAQVPLSHIFAEKATASFLVIDISAKLEYAELSNSSTLLVLKDHRETLLRKGIKMVDSCTLDSWLQMP